MIEGLLPHESYSDRIAGCGATTLDAPGGGEPPDDPSCAEDQGDDFELDPDSDQDEILRIISGMDDDALDALAATCFAAQQPDDVAIDDETARQLDKVMASMTPRQRAVMPHAAAGHPFINEAVNHELAYRKAGDAGHEQLARTLGSMETDPEKIDLLHAVCQIAAGNPNYEANPGEAEEAQVDAIISRMTNGQKAVLRAGGAGGKFIARLAASFKARLDAQDPTRWGTA
jgi:hypothetical protein